MAAQTNTTILKTLRSSLAIPFKNFHLMAPLITLILTLEFSMSQLNIRNAGILTVEMITIVILLPSQLKDNTNQLPPLLHDPKGKTLTALFTLNLVWYSIFSISCMVYSSVSIHNSKHITSMALFQRVRKTWLRPAITGFYISLLSSGFVVFATVLAHFANLNGILWVVFLGLCLYVYLAMEWMVAMVISVVEDDCYGLEALAMAARLVRGRRLQAFALMVIVTIVQSSLMLVILVYLGDPELSVVRDVVLVLVCLVKVFAYIVYAVFYCQCVKSKEMSSGGPDGGVLDEGSED